MSGLVVRITSVASLSAEEIAAGCRDAGAVLRDQVGAPERVRLVLPVEDVGEVLAWLEVSGPVHAAAGRRIVVASAVAL